MRSRITRSGARRLGDEYQDLIALEVLIDWLEHSDRYQWIRVEADQAGYLDDVMALTRDGALVVKQVKYSTDPDSIDDPWTWKALLSQPKGVSNTPKASLLQKWSTSLEDLLTRYQLHDASLVSNRRPASDIKNCLSSNNLVDFDQLSSEVRQELASQLNGEEKARTFLSAFHFRLNQPNLYELEEALQRRFYRLGGEEQGWLNLKEALRFWVAHRDEPPPNGEITLAEVRKEARWYQLQGLPQRFEVPNDFVLPSEQFHKDLMTCLTELGSGCMALTGSPGVGKSTYASFLYNQLRENGVPVIRHHYFLSLSDRTGYERLDHQRAAESLMHDLAQDHAKALGTLASTNPRPTDLRRWVEASGTYYAQRDKSLVVIIDGLDHVWRERRSIDELDKLLAHLLPVPDGILVFIVMQPVDDSKLPPSLLRAAPRKSWSKLPLLDSKAVEKWLRHHEDELLLSGNSNIPDHVIERLAEAFYRKSNGHPLHLRYSLRALQEQGRFVTEETIEQLPGCPHEDITAYYADLWRALTEESREILHLLTACPWAWPRTEIFDCLDSQGLNRSRVRSHLRQVEHLLLQDDLGLRPFHGSLLVFVEGKDDHQDYALVHKERALKWLQTQAPDYWNWAYEWTLEADLGNEMPLVNGPSRQWAAEALAKRRPRHNIMDILSRSLECSLEQGNLPRAVEVGLVQNYCFTAYEFQRLTLERLLFPQLGLEEDPHLRASLRANLIDLTDGELSILAEAESKLGSQRNVQRCRQELIDRLRTGRSYTPNGEQASWSSQVTPILEVEALSDTVKVEDVIHWAVRNRENGYTRGMLSIFCSRLRVHRQSQRMRDASKAGGRLATDIITDGVNQRDIELLNDEFSAILQYAVLLALEEGLDFDNLICTDKGTSDPFVAIYAVLRRIGDFDLGKIQFPPTSSFSPTRQTPYDNPQETQELFYRSFFCLLANHLLGRREDNTNWLEELGQFTWARRFVHHLDLIASELADLLLRRSPPSFGWFYQRISGFAGPQRPYDGGSITDLGYSRAASSASVEIGMDILPLVAATGGQATIRPADLQTAFASGYCDPQDWMDLYVSRRQSLLDVAVARWLLEDQASKLSSSIEPSQDRAYHYAVLASVAALHGLDDETKCFIDHATDNLLAHGYHKDMLFNEILGVIRTYHTAYPESRQSKTKSPDTRALLLELAPAIAAIEDYTDGDETGHLPREFADALSEIAPDLLPIYYQWLCDIEEHHDALHAFQVFIRTADLSSPINQAVAKTAVDGKSIRILAKRADDGDENARVVVSSILDLLGEAVLVRPTGETESRDPQPDHKEDPPSPAHFPPNQFSNYTKELGARGIFLKERYIEEWAEYWVERGKKEQVFQVLRQALDQGVNLRIHDLMFELSLDLFGKDYSYAWLVKAYSEELGWSRYYTDKERATRRWRLVREYYPAKWFDFIKDTILGSSRMYGSAIVPRQYVRVVEYCVFMGQMELAEQLLTQMVRSSLEYVSPLILPTPEWVHEA